MALTYKNESNSNRDIEPVFTKRMVKYRSVRSSELENSEINAFKLDVSRIQNRLNDSNLNINLYLKYLNGDKNDINDSVNLDDGLSYNIDGVDFYFDDISSSESLKLDTTNKMSSRIFRLMNKISRLERE